jgi:exodeoxyribonuclease VII large subunit
VSLTRREVEDQVESLHQRLEKGLRYHLLMARQKLTELAQHGAFARMADALNRRQQKLDDLKYRLERAERQMLEQHRRRWEMAAATVRHYDVGRMLAGIRKELDARVAAIAAATRNLLQHRRSRIDRLSGQLEALSPLAILERGYALVFDSTGKLLKDAAQVRVGDEISARLARGSLTATVKRRAT